MGDRASVEKRKPRLLGEALGADDGAALAECGGEGGDEVVVEVENRGGGCGAAGDAADLLDDVAFERDWGGEDEGVESREVHALAGDLGHGDEYEAGRGGECFAGGAAVFCVLRAVEGEDGDREIGVVAGEECFECGDVLAALDEDEDVHAAGGGAGDGLGDEGVAGWVGGECVVEVGPVEVGLVVGELGGLHDVVLWAGALELHGVAYGAADQRQECVEAVGAERGGGQSSDEADVEVCENAGEAGGADAVALVDDEVAVVGEELRAGVGATDRLGGDDVDVAAELLRLAAVLADGGAVEEGGECVAPLGGELHVGDDDGGGDLAVRDQCAGHDGLASAGWSDEDAGAVLAHCVDGFALRGVELAGEFGGQGAWLWGFAAAGDGVAGGFEDADGVVKGAAVEGERAVVFVEADNQAGSLVGGQALGLADVELWVGDRAEVAKGGGGGGVDALEADVDAGIVRDSDFAGAFEGFELCLGWWLGKLGLRVWLEGCGDLFKLLYGGFGCVGEGGELVVGGLEVVVDEDGALLGAMLTGERERDQVAEAAALARQRVLGGEEAVEAGEVLLRAGLGEQADAYGAGEGGRDGLVEEEPDVCSGAGAGELDERVEAELTTRVGVGAGGGAEVGVVKIARQEEASIALAQRVQADVEVVVTAEVLLEDLRGEWSEVWVVPVVAAVGGRRPAFLLAVVPGGGVDVLAAAEVVGEQAELRVGGGGVGDFCGFG